MFDKTKDEMDSDSRELLLISNLEPSVISDLDRISVAQEFIREQCEASVDVNAAWKMAEPILDALADARSCILVIAERRVTATIAAYRLGCLDAIMHPDVQAHLNTPGVYQEAFDNERDFRANQLNENGVDWETYLEPIKLGK